MGPHSDVFLSHSSADKGTVEELARRLLERGITPWLDTWNLIPGQLAQEAMEEALASCSTCAVFIGPSGSGPWQNEEVRAAIDRRIGSVDEFRIIPVYLPGARRDPKSAPAFLRRHTWVEFGSSLDDENAFHRLICGIRGVAPGPNARPAEFEGVCPYRGLQAFEVSDQRFFFGRDELTARALERLRPSVGSRQELRFLGILGPSGSGKSSVVRAGLAAALLQGAISDSVSWPIAVMRPGDDAIESLALALSAIVDSGSDLRLVRQLIDEIGQDSHSVHRFAHLVLTKAPSNARLVIVVDQFEEVFTLSNEPARTTAFLNALTYAASAVGGQTFVIIVMRTDFYGRCASYPSLAAMISGNQILMNAMATHDLKAAIEEPARVTGLSLEPGLVDLLIRDSEGHVGALPLLQHALLELWERRNGNILTREAYFAIGGLEGALERRAEEIYLSFSGTDQVSCRRLLLRLVQPGQSAEATKRRTPLSEILTGTEEDRSIERIIAALSAPDARLLVTQGSVDSPAEATVELSHEAVIRSWKRLRRWIDEDREGLIVRRRLADATQDWIHNAFDDAFLFRGARLSQTTEWVDNHEGDINEDERRFLRASVAETAEESRLSDAASLDQLETAANGLWLDSDAMTRWLGKARHLTSAIDSYRRQLDRLEKYAERGTATSREAPKMPSDVSFEREFQRGTILNLIGRLERFDAHLAAAAHHVVTVLPRLEEMTIVEYRERWNVACREISDESICPRYAGLQIVPQVGLVPLTRNPSTGLYEFSHLLTGVVASQNKDGLVEMSDSTGVVLVLLPGGTFRMGAVSSVNLDDCTVNIDPHALPEESPVHELTVAPFFMGKFLMTQGQWLRAVGSNPSMFRPDVTPTVSFLHPVECVSWPEAVNGLHRVGLTLPTEAQWEYAARAGSDTIWWTGNDRDEVIKVANLESSQHTPVTHFSISNQFGLFDVIGNVWEWCLDPYGSYFNPVEPGTCSRIVTNPEKYTSRGGSFFNDATFARSAIRYFKTVPDARFNNRGFRATRILQT